MVAAGATGVATAAGSSPHVGSTKCGSKYAPGCTPPRINNKPLVKCVTGSSYTLPNLRFTSNAGIRTIQIREGARTLKLIKFKGRGRTRYTLKGLRISTLGLASGGHPLTVRVTDVRGRTTSKRLSLSVCAATPRITSSPLNAKCVSAGSSYTLPKLTFTSSSGIRRIQVQEGGRTIKSISFSGSGRVNYPLAGLRISSVGLSAGGHPLTVKVTDVRGKSSTKTLRFSVCVTTPVFTG